MVYLHVSSPTLELHTNFLWTLKRQEWSPVLDTLLDAAIEGNFCSYTFASELNAKKLRLQRVERDARRDQANTATNLAPQRRARPSSSTRLSPRGD